MFDWAGARLDPMDAAPREYTNIELGQLTWHNGTVTCTATCRSDDEAESVTIVFPFARLAQVITNESDDLGLVTHVAPLRRILWEVGNSPLLRLLSSSESVIALDVENRPEIVRHFAIISGESTAHIVAPATPVVVSENAA